MATGSRRSTRRRTATSSSNNNNNNNRNNNDAIPEEVNEAETAAAPAEEPPSQPRAAGASAGRRSVAASVRERHRHVAEREASRLARPEVRSNKSFLGHANRQKSAVTSTPFGSFVTSKSDQQQSSSQGQQGQQPEEWCGPFAVARQMIAQREEARRKREEEQAAAAEDNQPHHPLDEVMEEFQMERKRKAHPSLTWKSQVVTNPKNRSGSLYAKRKRRVELLQSGNKKVPTLFQLCLNCLVDHFDQVESLGDGVGSSIRNAIARELVAQSKLDGVALEALLKEDEGNIPGDGDNGGGGMDVLELIDASEISQEQMSDTLKRLLPAGLRYLSLQHAGRCFGPKTVQAMLSTMTPTTAAAAITTTTTAKAKSSATMTASTTTSSCSLFALSIGGAYLLKDADAAALLRAMAPTLSSLEFAACPFLGAEFCQALVDSYGSNNDNNNNTLIELSLEFLPLSLTNGWSIITSHPDAWRHLKSLSLRRLEHLQDEHVTVLLQAAGERLEHLDLSYNVLLTDDILSSMRRHNPHLRSLILCGLKALTSAGLETYFTMDLPGLPPPPMLRILKLASCDHEVVTDAVVELAALASSRKYGSVGSGDCDVKALAQPSSSFQNTTTTSVSTLGGLIDLDVSGSRHVTDTSMEILVSTSSTSLRTLNVSFCPFVTDQGLGYLVSKAGSQLSKIEIWGCSQITDDFLDGHSRAQDGSLEIVGAWMKKSGTSSVR